MLVFKLTITLIFCTLISFSQVKQKSKAKYTDGNELIKAMHKKYEHKWYKYFTFSQNMVFYRNDSVVKKDVWHEAAALPGSLLIKFETKNSKNGVLFSNNTVYSFRENTELKSFPMVHDLLLIGLDVYFNKPETTSHLLDSLGYNLNIIREAVFENRPVYVVGAEKGDLKSRQFWIDKERLYMIRVIYPQGKNTNDVTFANYEKIKKHWIAKTIVFLNNGKLSLIEHYYDIKFPTSINADWFYPKRFNEVVLD